MLKPVDYDDRQHRGYTAGRDLGPEHARRWAEAFAVHAPVHRPLDVLDLGSGTGRFTTALAEAFEGDVLGVEPSDRMLEVSVAANTHARVRFGPGRAEAIPGLDDAFDLILMFLSFHHVADRAAAAAEIARVLRPGGRVLIRSPFSDRFPALGWQTYFARARAIELQMFPPLTTVEAVFTEVGLRRIALVRVEECFADSLAEHAEKLRHRAISTFDHMSEAEISEGFARLDAAVAAEHEPTPVVAQSDLLVLGGDGG